MSKQWQVVDEHGEVVDQDDASSIASDWSMMQLESDTESTSRPRSPAPDHVSPFGTPSITPGSPQNESRRYPSLPNSLDSPVRQDPNDRSSIIPTRWITVGRPTCSASARHNICLPYNIPNRVHKTDFPDPVESRQMAARWNSAIHANRRRSQRSNQNVDTQHAKCLRRGAQISSGFQRRQVRLLSGGQLPHGRKPTN
ncbi:hypothetical protein AHF37_02639 [Paragonimus kellicotti]|nr:hypothetical protein AHF37_02639 [Paragonimus kellicotti]